MRTLLWSSSVGIGLSLALPLAIACNRGPEPKPMSDAPAAAVAPATAAPSTVLAPTQAAPSQAAPHASGTPSAGGLTWDAPAPFEGRPPSSSMRAAEYVLPAVNGEAPLMTVFYFGPGQGGNVEDNLARWISQFTQPDGRDSTSLAQRSERQVNGMKVTTVDLTGTFAGGGMGQPTGPHADHRLLGAIVEGPEGPVFFKLTGPSAALESARSAFDHMLQSMRPLH